MIDLEAELSSAVRHFWETRLDQQAKQGGESGIKDAGNRSAVTGGKHADGFIRMIAKIVQDAGLAEENVHFVRKSGRTIPGYFRPTKDWDIVVSVGSDLIAAVEVKSQVGSFGNNFNNRIEEALGNSADFWMAYKRGIYAPSAKPWLGYLFMLEESPDSLRPKARIDLKPFPIDEAFQGVSYAKRYQETCLRLVREMNYDAVCFFTSNAQEGRQGRFSQPNPELSIANFAVSLESRIAAYCRLKG